MSDATQHGHSILSPVRLSQRSWQMGTELGFLEQEYGGTWEIGFHWEPG